MTLSNLFAQSKKTVVAYFSATGTTETVAKQLAKENGNWIFENYDEEIMCMVNDESVVDVVIK